MSLISRRFYVLAGLLIALNVGGLFWIKHELVQKDTNRDGQPIRLVSSFPTQDIDQAERLSLHFDRDVGDVAQLNEMLNRATPFELSPLPDGEWMWATPKRLDFVLNQPLPAGRSFKVKPAVGLNQQLGQVILVDHEIEFETRALKLASCRLISSDPNDVTFELVFNQAVAIDEALQSIVVWDGNSKKKNRKQLKVESLVHKPSKSVVLRCSRPSDNVLGITVDAKLTGHGATRPIGKRIEKTLNVEPVMAFLRMNVRDLGVNGLFNIDVYFTTGLAADQKLPPIELIPAVEDLESSLVQNWRSKGRILRLQGRFESGRRYQVKLPKTLLSVNQKTLGEEARISVDVPDRDPQVEFSDYRGILSPGGNLNLDVQSVNVKHLLVKAARVHANNLVSHLQGEWKSRTSRALGEQVLKVESKKNETTLHTLSLRDVLQNGDADPAHGIYHVSIDATDEAWVRDSAVVTITDLALTVKQTHNEMLVWVTSLASAQPIANAAVSTISYNNQSLASAITDEFGIARIAIDEQHPDGKPWLVLAQSEDQTTWHRCDRGHWVLDHVDQSGRTPRALDVMLFTDRGTYRPGETIHLSGIIRDDKGNTVPSFPIDLNVVRPDGKTVETLKIEPEADSDGTFNLNWRSPERSWTGPWRFRATLIDDDEIIGATHAYVEEFIPIRVELKTVPTNQLFLKKDSAALDVKARYLFGPPAAGLQVRIEGDYRASRFRSKKLPKFLFGPRKITGRHSLESITSKLSSAGTAQINIKDPESLQAQRYGVSTVTTVTEDGGRSVSRVASFVRDNTPFHIGLNIDSKSVRAKQENQLQWCLRTPDDKVADFESLEFELVQVEYDNVLRRVNGRAVWESVERVEPVWKHSIAELAPEKTAKSGIGSVRFTCPKTGTHRLRVTARNGTLASEIEFFANDATANSTSLALNQPEQIKLRLDRDLYKPEEAGFVWFEAPFAGRVLLTFESDRIHWARVFELDKKVGVSAFEIPKGLRGGGFLTASIVRAVNSAERQWLPHRARGIVRVHTDHTDARIPVTISVPKRIEPNSEIEVVAQSIPNAMVQVWAVDEGILATSGFQTPNPHGHFFAQRANRVTSSDVFGRLLADHQRPANMNRIGGGGDAGGVDPLRRNPVPSRRREPAVVWSTFKRSDEQGRVTITTPIPNFTGELRWMAIAVKGDRYGHASESTTVTSDFLVEATWPRFAAPGDRFDVPVRLINTTDEEVKATIATNVSGPLQLTLDNPEVVIGPQTSQVIRVQVLAKSVGSVAGEITVRSNVGGKSVVTSSEFALPVRSANPLVTDHMFLTLKAGESFAIDMGKNENPGNQKALLTLSSDSNLDLQPAVDHLLKYPYGCVEQTASQLRAVLAAGALVNVDGARTRADAVNQLTTAGVSRLWAMQLKSGALSYWPGQSTPHEWGTTYATLALLDAQRQGVEVDDRFLDSLRKFLEVALHQSSGRDANLTAEMCLALSRLDSPPIGWMSRMTERIDDLDMGGRASLALAWFEAGRKDRVQDALPDGTMDLPVTASYTGRFTTATTQRAQLARALQQIDPSHQWLPRLIAQIKQSKENGVWLSTLENSLVVETLAANRALGESTGFTGKLTVGSDEFDFKPGTVQRIDLSKRTGNIAINSAGEGNVSLSFISTSLSTDPPEDLDRLIKVRRRWLNRHGKPIDHDSIRVGDLVVVEVTLEAVGRKAIESIAIVDPLPTGFEVENPRLRSSDQMIDTSVPSHTEFLDDRIVLFSEALPSKQTFQYSIRAVTEGDFALPPIQATCMYNESIESVFGAGRAQVRRFAASDALLPLATKPKPESTRK
jgi:uncharacterized protein YfaS (alpha-2-macroglobulin family)